MEMTVETRNLNLHPAQISNLGSINEMIEHNLVHLAWHVDSVSSVDLHGHKNVSKFQGKQSLWTKDSCKGCSHCGIFIAIPSLMYQEVDSHKSRNHALDLKLQSTKLQVHILQLKKCKMVMHHETQFFEFFRQPWIKVRTSNHSKKKETTQRLENRSTISGKHPIVLGSSKITCYPKNNIKIKHGFGWSANAPGEYWKYAQSWNTKKNDAQKLNLIINCFADPTELGSSSNCLLPSPPPKKRQTNIIKCMYTHPQHLPRWDSSTNGSQEMGRYIVDVAYWRQSIAKLFGMHCIVPPDAHNLGAHLHQLVAQISCHFPLDLCLHIHQQQQSLIKKCLTLLFREKAQATCFLKAQVSPQASEQKMT